MADKNYWNVHEHKHELKISDECSIYHPEQGQLCTTEKHYDVVLYFPLKFVNKSYAQKWIDSGTIAELQESLSDLSVCFSNVSLRKNHMEYNNENY